MLTHQDYTWINNNFAFLCFGACNVKRGCIDPNNRTLTFLNIGSAIYKVHKIMLHLHVVTPNESRAMCTEYMIYIRSHFILK